MEIWWSGTHRVEVYLPSDYAHEMCGVCGDFNFDPSNDLILGPKCSGDGEPGSLVMALFTLSQSEHKNDFLSLIFVSAQCEQ